MIKGINITFEEVLQLIDIKYHETNAQILSIPGGTYAILEVNEALILHLTSEADDTAMKATMTAYSENNSTEFKYDNNSFFHAILGFLPEINMFTKGFFKSDNMVSFTTAGKIHLKNDCFDRIIVSDVRPLT